MSLPKNNKKNGALSSESQKNREKGSKFMKSNSKPSASVKKVRSTGANRGS